MIVYFKTIVCPLILFWSLPPDDNAKALYNIEFLSKLLPETFLCSMLVFWVMVLLYIWMKHNFREFRLLRSKKLPKFAKEAIHSAISKTKCVLGSTSKWWRLEESHDMHYGGVFSIRSKVPTAYHGRFFLKLPRSRTFMMSNGLSCLGLWVIRATCDPILLKASYLARDKFSYSSFT